MTQELNGKQNPTSTSTPTPTSNRAACGAVSEIGVDVDLALDLARSVSDVGVFSFTARAEMRTMTPALPIPGELVARMLRHLLVPAAANRRPLANEHR